MGNFGVIPAALIISLGCCGPAQAEPRSGYEYVKPETRALQDDDFENPGLLTVEQGKVLFNDLLPKAGKRCADCHQADAEGLDPGVITAYPLVNARTKAITTLQDQIIACGGRTGAGVLAPGEERLVALETFVRHLAKGRKVAVDTRKLDELLGRGEQLFSTRYGLIDMSCQHCHGYYSGQMIRGQHISQGMGNGFPAYRLDIGEMTTLQQRIQQCMNLMRAEPFVSGSDELRLMELYMMSRSNGLVIETPAVRY